MKNVIFLGSGRSGTSMVGGTLSSAGYFMGEHLVEARDSNPKGFFESRQVNNLNEQIMSGVVEQRAAGLENVRCDVPMPKQLWLARVPVGKRPHVTPDTARQIEAMCQRTPFCYKDPRFCYTLSAWRPFLDRRQTVFVCVFRDPSSTVRSICKEVAGARYLQNLSISPERALSVWTTMYSHVLETHQSDGQWLFLHYHQLLCEEGLDRLEAFVNAPVDRSFPEARLERNLPDQATTGEASDVYDQLCELAGYEADTGLQHAA